ncbi:MAG: hypothetical protein H6Q70_1892 [Firmicutes bacterium]|nr:hypothetical protein [Bacillota bacterium]
MCLKIAIKRMYISGDGKQTQSKNNFKMFVGCRISINVEGEE